MELIDGLSTGESIGAVGDYRIDKWLGQGGMGVVLLAFDSKLLRLVAIKFLTPRLAASRLARIRFTREAQAAAAINHENVVTIHDMGEHEGLPYMVMEYVAGISLAQRLNQEGILQLKSILRIGIQCASGLAKAHSQGLIHRDVKPANILLEGGLDKAKITDFGLCCVAAEPWRLTASGVLLGTPAYMSPEQAAGDGLDHRSDLFSLGSVLYQMCTGEPPFAGPSVRAILTRVRSGEPRRIRELNPDIPPALERQISRLMAKNPADRFASAGDVVRVLGALLAGTQGAPLDHSLDDPTPFLPAPETAPASPGTSKFEIVEEWDGPEMRPRADDESGASLTDPSGSQFAWRVLQAVGTAGGGAIAWVLLAPQLPWPGTVPPEELARFLLVLAGLAVFAWVASHLLQAVSARHTFPAKQRTGRRLRNSIGAAALLVLAIIGCLEWSAYFQAMRARLAVETRRHEFSHSLIERQEFEELIGRPADEVRPGPGRSLTVTYRWHGLFRSHSMDVTFLDNHLNHIDYSD
jgi:serine/threonine protein kinase